MLRTSYQFKEEGRSGDVHLKLIFGEISASTLRDQRRVEIHIIYNTAKVIFCCRTDVASDT